jgi:hypothetical protein
VHVRTYAQTLRRATVSGVAAAEAARVTVASCADSSAGIDTPDDWARARNTHAAAWRTECDGCVLAAVAASTQTL